MIVKLPLLIKKHFYMKEKAHVWKRLFYSNLDVVEKEKKNMKKEILVLKSDKCEYMIR